MPPPLLPRPPPRPPELALLPPELALLPPELPLPPLLLELLPPEEVELPPVEEPPLELELLLDEEDEPPPPLLDPPPDAPVQFAEEPWRQFSTVVMLLFTAPPVLVAAATIPRLTIAAIKPYSMADAPALSLRRFLVFGFAVFITESPLIRSLFTSASQI